MNKINGLAVELRNSYKKCFTQKVQITADFETGEILSSDFCSGRTHDFKLFKESGAALQPHVLILADAGYQGITKIHKNSRTPFKKKKNCRLSEEEKAENRKLSKKRIKVEHIFRKLKIFRIAPGAIPQQKKKVQSQVQSYRCLLQSCSKISLKGLMQEVCCTEKAAERARRS